MKTRELVSTSFVIPYPPGFPILVPGQVISEEIIDYMLALDVSEIYNYRPDFGLGVLTAAALESVIIKNSPLLAVSAAITPIEVVVEKSKPVKEKIVRNKKAR